MLDKNELFLTCARLCVLLLEQQQYHVEYGIPNKKRIGPAQNRTYISAYPHVVASSNGESPIEKQLPRALKIHHKSLSARNAASE